MEAHFKFVSFTFRSETHFLPNYIKNLSRSPSDRNQTSSWKPIFKNDDSNAHRTAKRVAHEFPDRHAPSHLFPANSISPTSRLAAVGIVVALTFPNTVIRVRATAAPLNAACTAKEFEFYLSDSESKRLLTLCEGNTAAESAASKLQVRHATAALSAEDSKLALSLPPPSASRASSPDRSSRREAPPVDDDV
ncbi:unnamed protein product [Linum trigynum]|uniref:Uncharacterized protein n=1 Tax=Linum trigynum TaxID=586398 RepID=A0AAV2CKA1_9ROSI